MFDINQLKAKPRINARYRRQLDRTLEKNGYTENIEKAIEESISNIQKNVRSFVIYGEPQSGKTEMMISLTARLLDEGFKIVIVLLNDSVQLLNQNLERFSRSGIDPAPKNFSEILDPVVNIKNGEWIIFSKKNYKDLQKLLAKIGAFSSKVVIDDEADFASPNAKINKGEKTKINDLIGQLIGTDGVYIGVTATPGRLDLNNTFRNENEKWVDFPPHLQYKGQDTFFPAPLPRGGLDFGLVLLPDASDTPKFLREAMLSFIVRVAYLNLKINSEEKNYSILIHTSGRRADHTEDYKQVVKFFDNLKAKEIPIYGKVWNLAKEKFPGDEDQITEYISDNSNRYRIVVMNSDSDKKNVDSTAATNPSSLFTVAIGGNIVSRGVTFDNLLSMFFTRDALHKIQQDTYIQRARMFGTRGNYLPFFELHIPQSLYLDWHKCFLFHRLSLESIRRGNGSPVWLANARITAVAPSSIDKTNVSFDSGEMSFEIFDLESGVDAVIEERSSPFARLRDLQRHLGESKLPTFLLEFINQFSPNGEGSVAIHSSGSIAGYKDVDQENISRARGFIGRSEREETKFPDAIHHIKILHNAKNRARVFYKYKGDIKFLRHLRQAGK